MKYFFPLSFLVACSNTENDASNSYDMPEEQEERYEEEYEEDEERYEEDEEQYEEEYEENENGSQNSDDPNAKNILPLGDSITEGVPHTYRYSLHSKLIQQNYSFDFVGSHTNGGWDYPESGWDRDNEGWAGWTTQSIQEELLNWLPQYNVDIALIHLGTNDAGGGDVGGSAAAMTSIIEQLRARNPSVSICMAQIIPFGSIMDGETAEAAEQLNDFVDNWNARLANLASDMTTPASPIVLVDMNSDFGTTDLDYDGVHPSQAGAEKMADKWSECISSF